MAAQFRQLLPSSFLDQAQADVGVKLNNSLYSPLVVLWLLVAQRLQPGSSLQVAVLQLLCGLPATFWPRPCKRVRDWLDHGKLPSSHTGAYNQARQALPLSLVHKCCDHILQQLLTPAPQPASGHSCPAFLLDGSSIGLPHTPQLCKAYPPGANQYGENHWPMLRVLVAHDLHTGLAVRPEWGPMYGPHAVSEQVLLERALDRLPAYAIILGDANFGVFSVAYSSTQRGHPVVLRLTATRAQRLAGEPLHDGIDRVITWKPTRHDRKSHPQLPADACVVGRFLVRQVQPNDGGTPFLLALFTTLSASVEEVLQLYGKRWRIETDLRTLKSTLRLDELTCSTADMVAKEIEMAMVAYNLVRALIGCASELSGTPPRGYSFTKVRLIVETFTPLIVQASTPAAAQQFFDQMMKCVQQSKLPHRKRKRPSYPRQVWKRASEFPSRKT